MVSTAQMAGPQKATTLPRVAPENTEGKQL